MVMDSLQRRFIRAKHNVEIFGGSHQIGIAVRCDAVILCLYDVGCCIIGHLAHGPVIVRLHSKRRINCKMAAGLSDAIGKEPEHLRKEDARSHRTKKDDGVGEKIMHPAIICLWPIMLWLSNEITDAVIGESYPVMLAKSGECGRVVIMSLANR